MSVNEDQAVQIRKLKRARNIFLICAVLAAGTATALTGQLQTYRTDAASDSSRILRLSNENETMRLERLILSSKLDTISKACAGFEYKASSVSTVPRPSWETELPAKQPTWAGVPHNSVCNIED